MAWDWDERPGLQLELRRVSLTFFIQSYESQLQRPEEIEQKLLND